MNRKSYQKLQLKELNVFDAERILRENIFDLEKEIVRIKEMIEEMILQKIPSSVILSWIRQLENNASEILYTTSLLKHDLSTQHFSAGVFYRKGRDAE